MKFDFLDGGHIVLNFRNLRSKLSDVLESFKFLDINHLSRFFQFTETAFNLFFQSTTLSKFSSLQNASIWFSIVFAIWMYAQMNWSLVSVFRFWLIDTVSDDCLNWSRYCVLILFLSDFWQFFNCFSNYLGVIGQNSVLNSKVNGFFLVKTLFLRFGLFWIFVGWNAWILGCFNCNFALHLFITTEVWKNHRTLDVQSGMFFLQGFFNFFWHLIIFYERMVMFMLKIEGIERGNFSLSNELFLLLFAFNEFDFFIKINFTF